MCDGRQQLHQPDQPFVHATHGSMQTRQSVQLLSTLQKWQMRSHSVSSVSDSASVWQHSSMHLLSDLAGKISLKPLLVKGMQCSDSSCAASKLDVLAQIRLWADSTIPAHMTAHTHTCRVAPPFSSGEITAAVAAMSVFRAGDSHIATSQSVLSQLSAQ